MVMSNSIQACSHARDGTVALAFTMDSISALQYLSQEQLQNLIRRLQDEVAHLRHQLADAEERNRILQFALPQLVRDCLMDTVQKMGSVSSSIPKGPTESTVTPSAEAPSIVMHTSVAIQTDTEQSGDERFTSVHTQTVPRVASPVQMDASDVGRIVVAESPVTPELVRPKELQTPNKLPSTSGQRRRKRKSSPARVTESVSTLVSSKPSENVFAHTPELLSTYSPQNGDVIGSVTNEAKRQKPLVVDFHNLTARHLMGETQNEPITAEPGDDKSGIPDDDCVFLSIDDQNQVHEEEVKPETCELPLCSLPPPPPLFNSVFPTNPNLCMINGGGGSASDTFPEDEHTEMDWNDFIRVRDEIVSDPNITTGRHWLLYKAASEWTRATCAIMSALFDADQMANSTVLGRSSTEPRDRLPSDRVNFIVTTICRQFGVPASKVRARMAQKCKDERRKRRLVLQQNSFETSTA